MKKSLFFVLLSCFLGISTISTAQFFDQLSNPQISVRINHPPGLGLKISKVSFNPATGKNVDQIIDALIQDFVSNNVEVIDRANLNAILAEHDLNASGFIDKTNAVAIGKIIGPSALVTVKVFQCETKIQKDLYRIDKRYNYETKTTYQVRVNISRTNVVLRVSIQTTDLTTGRIFQSQSFNYSPSLEAMSEQGIPDAASEFEVQEIAYKSFAGDVHRMFFPWSEQTTLYYFDDKDGELKEAFKALKAGDEPLAFNLSERNLETCKQATDIKPKILAHAYYNMGMSYMIRNQHDKAIENFQEAQKLRPGKIVTEAISDCQKAQNLMMEMQKVDEKAALEAAKTQAATTNAIQAHENNTLKNVDIITLTKNKLSNAIIINKIKNTDCKFDTSPDALQNLTIAGVSDDVIIEMMNKK